MAEPRLHRLYGNGGAIRPPSPSTATSVHVKAAKLLPDDDGNNGDQEDSPKIPSNMMAASKPALLAMCIPLPHVPAGLAASLAHQVKVIQYSCLILA